MVTLRKQIPEKSLFILESLSYIYKVTKQPTMKNRHAQAISNALKATDIPCTLIVTKNSVDLPFIFITLGAFWPSDLVHRIYNAIGNTAPRNSYRMCAEVDMPAKERFESVRINGGRKDYWPRF